MLVWVAEKLTSHIGAYKYEVTRINKRLEVRLDQLGAGLDVAAGARQSAGQSGFRGEVAIVRSVHRAQLLAGPPVFSG